MFDLLQCMLFRHVVLDILHGIDLRNTGHKAPTYRQTEQCSHLQKSKLHADSNSIAMRWLRAVLKLLLHRGCNLKPKESGVASCCEEQFQCPVVS
jgi:hypothetical protein